VSLRSIAALVLAGAACATLPVEIRQAIEDAFSAKYSVQNRFVRLFRMRHPDLLRLLPR